jgi:hypothetical protein
VREEIFIIFRAQRNSSVTTEILQKKFHKLISEKMSQISSSISVQEIRTTVWLSQHLILYGLFRKSCHKFWVCCTNFPALNVPEFLCQTASKCMHSLCCMNCTFLSCTTSKNLYCMAYLLAVPSASISVLYLALECMPMLNNFLSSLARLLLFLFLSKNSFNNQQWVHPPYPNRLNEREGEKSSNPMVELR